MTNMKALMERRAELQQQMDNLVSTADIEKRAMSDEEAAQFDAAEKEIRAIDDTISREERARRIEKKTIPTDAEERAEAEEKAFADYVMGKVSELRAGEQNMDMANNGAIIPTTMKEQAAVTHKVTIRYNPSVNADMRIKYGDRLFDILHIIDTWEQHREMVLLCKELI